MRSLYGRILLWCVATLAIAFGAGLVISRWVADRSAGGDGPFQRTFRFHLAEARRAYELGGVPQLKEYLDRQQRYMKEESFLTDAAGHDLVTGVDRSGMFASVGQSGPQAKGVPGGRLFVIDTVSEDRQYHLIVLARPPFSPWIFVPYYLVILAMIALLCWLLAINIASPIGKLAGAVRRFGAGDLSVRVDSSRKDEIGELGRAFDVMADRIETLVTAERRLLQDVSHELRSPLARLTFAAELIRTAEDRNAAVARLRKEIDRLTELVSTLLEMTRLEGDPEQRRSDTLDVRALVSTVVNDCRVEAEARGCRLTLSSDGDLVVRGDRELIRRAIENVLRNGIRYAPVGTTVETSIGREKHDAVISVRDYGPGVPEQALPRLFSPFYRVDSSRDSASGGLGLGLAIAQRAVRVHHGNISARNVSPGLLVSIKLPCDPVTAAEPVRA